jgi:hypothetical protein
LQQLNGLAIRHPFPAIMTDSANNPGVRASEDRSEREMRYPENRVVAFIDTREQLESAVTALTSGGFLASEIEVIHGAAASEKLRESTGRSGLAHLAMRFAESIGLPNDETRIKNQYADGLARGQILVTVLAPSEDRRAAAGRILEEHGGTNVRFFGPYTIEHVKRRD